MSEDQYIITTLLRAQLHEAREAIRAIWTTHQDTSQTEMQHAADMDQVIFHAAELLPEAEKAREQETKVRNKQRRRTEKFEDLF